MEDMTEVIKTINLKMKINKLVTYGNEYAIFLISFNMFM